MRKQHDIYEGFEVTPEEVAAMNEARELLKLKTAITAEVYDQLRSVLEDYVEGQPHYYPNWNGPDSYLCDACGAEDFSGTLLKEPEHFVHQEGCLVVVAQQLLKRLRPRHYSGRASTGPGRRDATGS